MDKLFATIESYTLINICGEETFNLSHRDEKIYLLRKYKSNKIVAVYPFIDFLQAKTYLESILKKYTKFCIKDSIFYISQKYVTESAEENTYNILNSLILKPTKEYSVKKGLKQLWHGTKRANLIKIIKHGFKLPKEMSAMFGLGVYFADVLEKSLQYCDPLGLKVVLLCNVDTGKSLELTEAHPYYRCPINYDSVKGIKSLGGLKNNEYVIYDCSKIQILRIFIMQ